mgnify:FL=1
MKIVFLGLASTYTPGLTYQDNYLCTQTLADGHAVTYLSNPEKFVNGEIVETGAEDTVLPDGLHLIRLPYVKLGTDIVTKKVRVFRGVYDILEREKPDLIFCHNLQYWSVRDVVRYKKDHPAVKFYADTHTDYNNSGTNWLSLHVLHRIFYRHLVRLVPPYLDRYFYVADECRQFSHEVYGIPNEKMEFYPLGGTLLSDEEYAAVRAKRRAELGLGETDRLYIHSGKLDALKRSDELLRAFSAVDDPHAVLAVIGSIPREREAVLLPLIAADKRIRYLGWKSGEELQEYLCAADLYCQPGSQSATMQNALCRYCPVMLYPHPSHTVDYDRGEVLWVKTQADMEAVFRSLAADPAQLAPLRENAERLARELLDYRKLAARLYQ